MSRRSLSYEARLYKYAKRGFAVAVPGLQRYEKQSITACGDALTELLSPQYKMPR